MNKFKVKSNKFLIILFILGLILYLGLSASIFSPKKNKVNSSVITNLQNQIDEKDSLIYTLQLNLEDKDDVISLKNSRIDELESELEDVYEYDYDLTITYMNGNVQHAKGKARAGGTILVAPNNPTKTSNDPTITYEFAGWSLTDNGTVINLNSTTFNQDTTLYAIFNEIVVVPENPVNNITDLTGTTWQFDSDPFDCSSSVFQALSNLLSANECCISLDFTSNNINFYGMEFSDRDSFPCSFSYYNENDVNAYDVDDGWLSNNYRTITITGGDDVSDLGLIDWLLNSATLILN